MQAALTMAGSIYYGGVLQQNLAAEGVKHRRIPVTSEGYTRSSTLVAVVRPAREVFTSAWPISRDQAVRCTSAFSQLLRSITERDSPTGHVNSAG